MSHRGRLRGWGEGEGNRTSDRFLCTLYLDHTVSTRRRNTGRTVRKSGRNIVMDPVKPPQTDGVPWSGPSRPRRPRHPTGGRRMCGKVSLPIPESSSLGRASGLVPQGFVPRLYRSYCRHARLEPTLMIRAPLVCFGFVLLALVASSTPPKPPFPGPSIPVPTPCGPTGLTSTAAGTSGSTPRTRASATDWEKPDAPGFDRTIVVPFPWESELSGIHQPKGRPKVGWYRRRFTVPKEFPADQRVWLRFEAVNWRADVWVNGQKVGEHEGGYTPSRSISPMPSVATARIRWSSAPSTRPIPACPRASRSTGTRLARASGRRSGWKRGRRLTSPTSA